MFFSFLLLVFGKEFTEFLGIYSDNYFLLNFASFSKFLFLSKKKVKFFMLKILVRRGSRTTSIEE